MNAAPLLVKVVLRMLAAVVIGLITFPVAVLAFHPWEGPIDGYTRATLPERYFALAFSIVVFLATLWRLLRGSTIQEEMKRLLKSYTGRSEA